jgi:small GTP-binding protein
MLIAYGTNAFPGEYIPPLLEGYVQNVSPFPFLVFVEVFLISASHPYLTSLPAHLPLDNNIPCSSFSTSAHVDIDGKHIYLSLFDTCAQDDYERLRPLQYPQTHVFVLTYSVVDPSSLETVRTKWHPEISNHCPGVPFILVGTKLDLREDPTTLDNLALKNQAPVSLKSATALCQELGACKVMECSALTQQGVKAVFDEAIRAAVGPGEGVDGGGKSSASRCSVM